MIEVHGAMCGTSMGLCVAMCKPMGLWGAMCGKSMGLCGAMCKPVGLCVGSPWGYVGLCVRQELMSFCKGSERITDGYYRGQAT